MPTPTIACPARAPSTAEAIASTMPSAVPGVGTLWVERMLPSSSTTPAAIFVPPMSTPMVSPMNPSVSVEPRYGQPYPSPCRQRVSVQIDALAGAGVLAPVAQGVVAAAPALLLCLDRGTVGGEELAPRGGEVVEDVRIAFDDRLDRGLGLLHDLLDHLLGGGSGDAAEERGLEAGQLLRDVVDELAQLLGGRARGRAVLGAAAGLLRREVLGGRRRPRVGVGRPYLVHGLHGLHGLAVSGVGRGELFAHDDLLTTVRPYDVTRTGVPGSRGPGPQIRVRREPDPQLALAQGGAGDGAAAQGRGQRDDPAELPRADDEFVAAPDQVQLVAYGTGQREVPHQDAVLGEVIGDGPLDGGGRVVDFGDGEGGEVVGAARVVAEVRDGMDVVRLLPLLQGLALLGDEAGGPLLRYYAVGDQGVGAQAAQGEGEACGPYVVGAGGAGFGDESYDGLAVGEDGLDRAEFGVPAGGGLVQPLRGHGDAGEPSEHGAQARGGLALGREQTAQVAAEFLGQGEKGEGLLGGRQVHDEQFVPLGERRVAQGPQEGEFLGAGEGGDLLGVQTGGAQQVEHVGGTVLEAGEIIPETGGGVGTPGGEVRGDPGGGGARCRAEHRAQGVGAVGTQHQGAGAVACGAQGGGGGDRRTTAAAGAGDQDGAHRGEP